MKTGRKKKNDKKGKDIRYANMLQRSTNEYFQKLTAVYKKFKKYWRIRISEWVASAGDTTELHQYAAEAEFQL